MQYQTVEKILSRLAFDFAIFNESIKTGHIFLQNFILQNFTVYSGGIHLFLIFLFRNCNDVISTSLLHLLSEKLTIIRTS